MNAAHIYGHFGHYPVSVATIMINKAVEIAQEDRDMEMVKFLVTLRSSEVWKVVFKCSQNPEMKLKAYELFDVIVNVLEKKGGKTYEDVIDCWKTWKRLVSESKL